jgi:hypothetical protein
MRSLVFAIAAAAALFAFTPPASSQEIELGPGGVRIEPHYHGRSVARPDCDELRKACLHKEELGEEGRGNCDRYRRFCRLY